MTAPGRSAGSSLVGAPGPGAVGHRNLVVGSPDSLRALAASLRDGGTGLADHAVRLGAAATAFGLVGPDFGGAARALADDVAAALVHESAIATGVGDGVADLADALTAADRAGLGGLIASPALGWGVVAIDAALLETFDVGPQSTLDDLHDALRRRRDLLVAAHGRPGTFGHHLPDGVSAEVQRLDALVRQLDAIVSGRPHGWAGVGTERWSTASGFLVAIALGRAQATAGGSRWAGGPASTATSTPRWPGPMPTRSSPPPSATGSPSRRAASRC